MHCGMHYNNYAFCFYCDARPITGVGGDKQQRNGRGQGGATAVGLHRGHGVRGRLQDAMRGARRR